MFCFTTFHHPLKDDILHPLLPSQQPDSATSLNRCRSFASHTAFSHDTGKPMIPGTTFPVGRVRPIPMSQFLRHQPPLTSPTRHNPCPIRGPIHGTTSSNLSNALDLSENISCRRALFATWTAMSSRCVKISFIHLPREWLQEFTSNGPQNSPGRLSSSTNQWFFRVGIVFRYLYNIIYIYTLEVGPPLF